MIALLIQNWMLGQRPAGSSAPQITLGKDDDRDLIALTQLLLKSGILEDE